MKTQNIKLWKLMIAAGVIIVSSVPASDEQKEGSVNTGVLDDGIYKIQGNNVSLAMENGWTLSLSRDQGIMGIMLKNKNGNTEQIDLKNNKFARLARTRVVGEEKIYCIDSDGDGIPEIEAVYSNEGKLKNRTKLAIRREQ